jgi:hypothetical protein
MLRVLQKRFQRLRDECTKVVLAVRKRTAGEEERITKREKKIIYNPIRGSRKGTDVPIRKIGGALKPDEGSIDKRSHRAVLEASRLAREARGIMVTIRRRMQRLSVKMKKRRVIRMRVGGGGRVRKIVGRPFVADQSEQDEARIVGDEKVQGVSMGKSTIPPPRTSNKLWRRRRRQVVRIRKVELVERRRLRIQRYESLPQSEIARIRRDRRKEEEAAQASRRRIRVQRTMSSPQKPKRKHVTPRSTTPSWVVRRQKQDELAATVGSWLSGGLDGPKDDGSSLGTGTRAGATTSRPSFGQGTYSAAQRGEIDNPSGDQTAKPQDGHGSSY